MAYLFDTTSPSTNPPDTEAVKSGALRIRGLKDALQALLSQLFNNDGTFATAGAIPGAALGTGIPGGNLVAASVTTTQIGPLAVLPGQVDDSVFGNGLTRTAHGPASVNVDGVTIGFDASTPEKIQVLNGSLALDKLTAGAQASLNRTATALITLTPNVLMTSAHSLAAPPSIARWVLVCQTADSGYNPGDEMDIPQIGGNNGSFQGGADGTNVFLVFNPNGSKFNTLNKSTGNSTSAALPANWKAKCYFQA